MMTLLTNKWTEMAPTINMVKTLGTEKFGSTFFSVINSISPINILFVIEWLDQGPLQLVMWEGREYCLTDQNRQLVIDHVAQLYRRFSLGQIEGPTSTLADAVVKSQNSRNALPDSYFFSDCGREFSGFSKDDDRTLYLGLLSKNKSFPVKEQGDIIYMAPLFLSMAQKHYNLIQRNDLITHSSPGHSLESLSSALLNSNSSLSNREAQVCAAIILGHSANSVGDLLDISPLTVATHRKRAYAKLNITSQNQLFGKLFQDI